MSDNSTDRKHLRFSFDMTEKLIECVKKRPYLYDTKDPQYKNVAMKVKVWEQIGKEISETGETAKTKWKSLRDNYGRYKKEMSDPTVQVKKFLRWPWANQLQFLDATIAEREKHLRSARSETPPPQQFLEISLTEPEVESASRDSNYSDSTPPVSPAPETSEDYGPRVKRYKRDNCIVNGESTELDAVGHLFKSYAQTFKSFTRRNQIALKVELAQLFADIEAKEMIENNQV